jgi:hypothetical protein
LQKLAIGKPGDAFEQDADRAAGQVMRMPEPRGARPCACGGGCPRCQAARPAPVALQTMRPGARDAGQERAPPIVDAVLALPGQALDPQARAFMEPRFGHSFAGIRVHDDAVAGRSAQAIGALAYASGQHVVFAPGQYQPGSRQSLTLLAHELAHTVQQGAADAMPVQRQEAAPAAADARASDPSFLICLVLCELGIPPSLWRTVVNAILSAVSLEYRERLGELRGSQQFEEWRAALTVMSTYNKIKLVVGFLGESRVGLLVIEHAGAQAVRRAILERLLAVGVRSAALEVASQILRRVAIAIEVAIALGCSAYCGATAVANSLLEFGTMVMDAVTSFLGLATQLGGALTQAIARPILLARASMDPANWNLTALPQRSRVHMSVIGLAFRLAATPDTFLASMGRPLNSYNLAQVLAELAQDINAALQARGGFAQLVTFTPAFLGGLTPLQLVDILRDYGLLSFLQDPGVLVDQQLAAPPP